MFVVRLPISQLPWQTTQPVVCLSARAGVADREHTSEQMATAHTLHPTTLCIPTAQDLIIQSWHGRWIASFEQIKHLHSPSPPASPPAVPHCWWFLLRHRIFCKASSAPGGYGDLNVQCKSSLHFSQVSSEKFKPFFHLSYPLSHTTYKWKTTLSCGWNFLQPSNSTTGATI